MEKEYSINAAMQERPGNLIPCPETSNFHLQDAMGLENDNELYAELRASFSISYFHAYLFSCMKHTVKGVLVSIPMVPKQKKWSPDDHKRLALIKKLVSKIIYS